MRNGINNETLQQLNRSLALGLIISEGITSRRTLVRELGLGKPAITNIVNELISEGLIEECALPVKEGERKARGLRLRDLDIKVLSARWMRHRFRASVYSVTGRLLAKDECVVSRSEDPMVTRKRVLSLLHGMEEKFGKDTILGLCVGVPGPYLKDEHMGKAIVSGYERLQELNLQELFREEFECPVITEHDAHLSAFCEWRSMPIEDRDGCDCMMGLQSIGSGIGAGIILNGDIFEGAFGIAGELGQTGVYFNGPKNRYGERGTLETYASSASVGAYVSQRLSEFPTSDLSEGSSYEEIVDAYEKGDPLAVWAFEMVASRLAYGLTSAIFLLNPGIIVIGRDYPASEHFMEALKNALSAMLAPDIRARIEIRRSIQAEDTTLKGGYYHVLNTFEKDASLYARMKTAMMK